jgi:transcription antitermination factor NusG
MPILTEGPTCYPADLFDSRECNLGEDQKLWVLHTKPRQEKALAEDLMKQRISFFLPVKTNRNRIRGKTVTSYLPLFTSYLFLKADPDQRVTALSTRRVVHSIPVGDQKRLWHDLHQLKDLLSRRVRIRTEACPPAGTIVEICSGPLTGFKGKLLGTDEGRRFVVEVDFIQQGASILLDKETEIRVSDWNF